MKKHILHTLGLAAMAALLCVFCGDNTTDGSEGGQVDTLLNKYNNSGGPGLIKYTVRFNANGGTGEIPPDVTVSDGNVIKLPAGSGMSNGNMDFDGWNTEANGTGATYPGGSTYTVTGDITLYAKWNDGFTPTTYTIIFNANEGSGTAPNNLIVNAGSSVTLPGRGNLARDGYEFGGWNTHSSGTGYTYAAGESYTPTASIELFARWNTGWVSKGNDIKNYKTIKVGTQTWMAENLDNPVNGSECYGNNSANCAKYGRLYMWLAARSACPAGWHLPLSAEWDILMEEVGGSSTAGTKLKSTTGWSVDFGTDDYGFSALPSGDITNGDWWSATEVNTSSAWKWGMSYSREDVSRSQSDKADMLSVRCVQDVDITLMFNANGGSGTVPTAMNVNAEGSVVTLPNGSGLSKNGYKVFEWNTSADGTGTGYRPSTSFTVRGNVTLYVIWREAFVDSRDGKSYAKVAINTQTWMAENLDYDVPDNTSDVCHNNSADSCAKYGRLYNWSTAMGGASSSSLSSSGVQGACPVGWHLPSYYEWQTLVDYASGYEKAGTKLKSSRGWNSYNGVPAGTDEFGFSALPGSIGNGDGLAFGSTGEDGRWWSATEFGFENAIAMRMRYDEEYVGEGGNGKRLVLSVRCVQD